MKRDARLWNIVCPIAALSIFFAVMIEARPSRFSRPVVRKDDFHVLTERQHVPDLAFFWKISQKISHDTHHVSSEQQEHLKEAFWNMYAQTVAVQEDASAHGAEVLAETALSTKMGIVLAGYMKALNGIFTPGHRDRPRSHPPLVKNPEHFLLVANSRTCPSLSGALAENDIRAHACALKDTSDLTQQCAWTSLAQVDLQTPLSHDLSQLQTLRL